MSRRRRRSKPVKRPRTTMPFAELCEAHPGFVKLAEDKAADGYAAPKSAVIFHNKGSFRIELEFVKVVQEENGKARWFDTHVYIIPKPEAAR